jgi:antitoxin component YwqK of YwqJK toxin-antitoxin module
VKIKKMMKHIFTTLLILGAFLMGQDTKACCGEIFTIDSLPQLEEYDFIAHVKILNEYVKNSPNCTEMATGIITVEIIELFKGKESINQIFVPNYPCRCINKDGEEIFMNSSTSITLSKGEEWILFGRNLNGKMTIRYCDRNQIYRKSDGLRDWQYDYGFRELRKLKELYQHPKTKFINEVRQEFYSNGQIEIEETYVNGKLYGERKIWYPNGVLFCKQFYVNDTLDGKSEWFYPSGQIYDEDYYIKGKHCNISRLYYDSTVEPSWNRELIDDQYKTEDSLKLVCNKVQPQYEIVFDSYGRAIISREYTRLGKIYSEKIIDPDRKFRVVIYYHDNGAISSIMYSLKDTYFGHYQTYDKNGFPNGGWDYDENGKVIK